MGELVDFALFYGTIIGFLAAVMFVVAAVFVWGYLVVAVILFIFEELTAKPQQESLTPAGA